MQWDVRGKAPYPQTVLSHPNVNLIVERDIARIYGVSRTTSTRLIEDHGWVVGVKFKSNGIGRISCAVGGVDVSSGDRTTSGS
ncbi:DUF6597 domain-containing transcriptional factor [Paenibacillus sp. SC116]|uniref:DUF6597 domain-containing transcriptional factor n=1 Tax=Paenibacillus sp. SC116 TaxID=2968986 RepID=UPI0028123607|nr:DUF6597 domain-containing transcriptional factor [Paenibacillus sp. SC116]